MTTHRRNPFSPVRGFSGNPVPPGTPELWFDASDIDLLKNSTLTDGQTIGTWKNKGSYGISADLVQATVGDRPVLRTNVLNGRSAVRAEDTSRVMATADFTGLAQANKYAVVFKNSLVDGTTRTLFDGSNVESGRNLLQFVGSNGEVLMYAGTVQQTAQGVSASNYNLLIATFNGASSALRFNKTNVSIGGTVGTAALGRFTLFEDNDATGSNAMQGDVLEVLVYDDATVSDTEIEAYFDSKYGSTWPKT